MRPWPSSWSWAGSSPWSRPAPGRTGVDQAQGRRPDLVLLDVDLPDIDGREVCRRMRQAGVGAPIIMLTGQTSDTDTIAGLESGANDYVSKPFKFAVLMARIRAQLRSHEQSEDAVFRLGPYEFRPAAKLLVDEKLKKIRAHREGDLDPQVPLPRR